MTDLPPGYRWATADEAEAYSAGIHLEGMIVVPLSFDSEETAYDNDEGDLAMPLGVWDD